MHEDLAPEDISRRLGSEFFGNIVCFREVGSTNDEAKRLARAGAPEGTIIVADYQSAGRGRLSRRWEAPPGASILVSILLRPVLDLERMHHVTMVMGLAAAEGVERETGLVVGLKWPNDLVLDGKKLGGILTDAEVVGDRLDYCVVGLGLNVNLNPESLPQGLLLQAASISHALGRPVERVALLVSVLRRFEERYATLQSGRSCLDEWVARLATIGQLVRVDGPDGVVLARAESVDRDGALLVRRADGVQLRIVAGDVLPARGADWPAQCASAILPGARDGIEDG